MVTRRELNTMLVAAALAPAPLARALAASAEQPGLAGKPVHFIFESMSPGLGFHTAVAEDAFDSFHVIKGDVSTTWFNELHPLWSRKSILTAGLTRESEFFILKTLAREYGYVVDYEQQFEDTCLVSWSLVPSS